MPQDKKKDRQNNHDALVGKLFRIEKNVQDFLDYFLPLDLKNKICLDKISYDDTSYISRKLKKRFSDIVVKTTCENEEIDIYILVEHKSGFSNQEDVLVQIIRYIYLMWQHDLDNNNPLRLIIPLVIYHGKRAWTVPASLRDYFEVDPAFKPYILDFKYLLFDTNQWQESNDEALRKMQHNIQLFSSLLLLKTAFDHDMEIIVKVLELWNNQKLFKNIRSIDFILEYLFSIRDDLTEDKLRALFDKANIPGGEIMPTLIDNWLKQGEKRGIERGRQEGKREGKIEGKLETAQKMLDKGYTIEDIMDITALSRDAVEKLTGKK